MSRYLTLFDSTYLIKGLLMLDSLAHHSAGPVRVDVIALDDVTANVLARVALPHVRVTKLVDLETAAPELLVAKVNRSYREYCWTLASVALRWRLGQVPPDEVVTYVDADLGFYSDPAACFAELGNRSIGIVPHRFAPAYQAYEATSGRFNVSWVSLRHDQIGRACADAWCAQVLEQCDALTCGDQRYLDAWPALYDDALHVFESPGIGVAPWNVFDYRVESNHKVTVDGHPVVFYHYHELQREPADGRCGLRLDEFRLTLGYPLRDVDLDVFYRDYCQRYRTLAEALAC